MELCGYGFIIVVVVVVDVNDHTKAKFLIQFGFLPKCATANCRRKTLNKFAKVSVREIAKIIIRATCD